MDTRHLARLAIDPAAKRRPQRSWLAIFIVITVVTALAALLAWPRASDNIRKMAGKAAAAPAVPEAGSTPANTTPPPSPTPAATPARPANGSVLTVSGYIINRERIEISPRFLGVVKWIGVKKGDLVTNNQVIVRLDDAEYQARLHQSEGVLAAAQATADRAELQLNRIAQLAKTAVESAQSLDDARLQLAADRASVVEAQGELELARTYLDWCTIRSPINGVILAKLARPNELVMPQSFGGGRGPSTALVALADPADLQVEIDINEADLSKISMNQTCHVSPEAYPDHTYAGHVAEIAPEADRSKGTLQIKVQIENPDHFLTPELSAKVDFLAP